jgi:hypothetical protein
MNASEGLRNVAFKVAIAAAGEGILRAALRAARAGASVAASLAELGFTPPVNVPTHHNCNVQGKR